MGFVSVLCNSTQYFVSFLVLQSSLGGEKNACFAFNIFFDVMWLLLPYLLAQTQISYEIPGPFTLNF